MAKFHEVNRGALKGMNRIISWKIPEILKVVFVALYETWEALVVCKRLSWGPWTISTPGESIPRISCLRDQLGDFWRRHLFTWHLGGGILEEVSWRRRRYLGGILEDVLCIMRYVLCSVYPSMCYVFAHIYICAKYVIHQKIYTA
jgi:hypothetical protein